MIETKDQWARDDPAFLVLLSFWLCGKNMNVILYGYNIAIGPGTDYSHVTLSIKNIRLST